MEPTSYEDKKRVYPAASRNQEPILKVLQKYLPMDSDGLSEKSLLLEVSSGTGQHAAYFAPHFPSVVFQPSEYDESLLESISAYSKACTTKNILPPMEIDITKNLSMYGFEPNTIDYIYCCNLIHISPYECTTGLFRNAGRYLKIGGIMITYGAYKVNGVITPESNVRFDDSLKARDPSWGLRDIKDLQELAVANDIDLTEIIEMPSNNKTLIWKKGYC